MLFSSSHSHAALSLMFFSMYKPLHEGTFLENKTPMITKSRWIERCFRIEITVHSFHKNLLRTHKRFLSSLTAYINLLLQTYSITWNK
jgi:hypothetical protein